MAGMGRASARWILELPCPAIFRVSASSGAASGLAALDEALSKTDIRWQLGLMVAGGLISAVDSAKASIRSVQNVLNIPTSLSMGHRCTDFRSPCG